MGSCASRVAGIVGLWRRDVGSDDLARAPRPAWMRRLRYFNFLFGVSQHCVPRLQQLHDAPKNKSRSGRGSQKSKAHEPDTQCLQFWGMSCSIPMQHDVTNVTRQRFSK